MSAGRMCRRPTSLDKGGLRAMAVHASTRQSRAARSRHAEIAVTDRDRARAASLSPAKGKLRGSPTARAARPAAPVRVQRASRPARIPAPRGRPSRSPSARGRSGPRSRSGQSQPPGRWTCGKRSHRRPIRTFRVVGVFVHRARRRQRRLPRRRTRKPTARHALLIVDAPPAVAPTTDPAQARRPSSPRRRRPPPRLEAAAQAKKATEVAKREASGQPVAAPHQSTPCRVVQRVHRQPGPRLRSAARASASGSSQMPCLDKLWTKESGWNPGGEHVLGRLRHPAGPAREQDGRRTARTGETNPVPRSSGAWTTSRTGTARPCGAWSYFQTTRLVLTRAATLRNVRIGLWL